MTARLQILVMLCGVLWLGSSSAWGAAQPRVVEGRPIEVTLYRGQAQVTRLVPVEGDRGPVEVVVTNLPQQVVGESLFAEAGAGMEVRAVRYRQRPVGEDTREEVKQIDTRLRDLADRLELNQQQQQVLAKRQEYLSNLETFTAQTARGDTAKGALDAEALQKMSLFVFEQRDEVVARSVALKREQRDLSEQLQLAQRERATLTAGSSRRVQEAVLFLEKTAAGAGEVRLTYLVNGCGWSPAYNLRADQAAGRMQIEYNAVITQMSGEDWSQVKLSLSTASPAMAAAAPGLAPFFVALMPGRGGMEDGQALGSKMRDQQQAQHSAVVRSRNVLSPEAFQRANWDVNTISAQLQCIELNASTEMLSRAMLESGTERGGPSLSYTLDKPVSIASRNDQQMIRIVNAGIDAVFYHVASPVLTEHVYREAEMVNTTGTDLLAGPVSVYLNGRFVGRTELVTVAQGQSFVLGLGADPQLRAARELVLRDESEQGANRVLLFRYRLVIENFKDHAATVRVYDRVPYLERSRQLRVTVDEANMSEKLSADEVYLRRERPQGILRWDIEIPASRAGARAKFVEYGYRLEFDRNFQLAMPEAAELERNRNLFDELQLQRRYNK